MAGMRAGVALSLWAEVEAALQHKPEPTPQQLQKCLEDLENTQLDSVFRSFFRDALRRLPPFPPGKQPRFKPQQRKSIRLEVQKQVEVHRRSRKEAYRVVAKKYDVHWRTIQNCCTKKDDTEHQEREDSQKAPSSPLES
jgi:hypothetical protein